MTDFSKRYGSWALVTGASRGIGREIASQLAAKGVNIIGVARGEECLKTALAEICAHHRVEVRAIASDLTEPGETSRLHRETASLDVGIVVANAGMEMTGDFVLGDLDQHRRLVQLNAIAPMELAHFFGRKMARNNKGALLLVSSLFGYQGVPFVAHYAATKAYILSLGEALSVELRRHGVDVSVLSPGLTSTEMVQDMDIDFSKMPLLPQSPRAVAKVGVRALGRKATVVSGILNKIMAWQNRLIPRSWPVRLFGFLVRRSLRSGVAPKSLRAKSSAANR